MTSLPPLPFTQPFSVGDRIYDTYSHWPIEATVTALTPRGFKCEYDNPVPFGRAAWGMMATGDEVFLDMPESDYNLKRWALIDSIRPKDAVLVESFLQAIHVSPLEST